MFEVIFLGTSASIPTATRSLPAILLKHRGERFLIDCGEGTQQRLMQASESLKISCIFLTHDHLDHVLGLGGLLLSISLRRMKPVPHIRIYGGGTTLARAELLASMIRSSGKSQAYVELEFIEVSPGIVFEQGLLSVTAFLTNHRDPLERPCFGYVFESAGQQSAKVIFTGDTGYMDSLIKIVRGADCLVSEATFASDRVEKANRIGHLTAAQAATTAAEGGVGCLMLHHVSRAYANDLERVLAEARAIFPNTLLPNDLDRFRISRREVERVI
jgi:ribonuclease Z